MQLDFISAVKAISDNSLNYGLDIEPHVLNAFKLFISSPMMAILMSPPSDLDRQFSSFTVFDLIDIPDSEKQVIFNIMLIHSISNMYRKSRFLKKFLIVDESINPQFNVEDYEKNHDLTGYSLCLEYAIRICRPIYGGLGFSYPAMSSIPPFILQNVSNRYVF